MAYGHCDDFIFVALLQAKSTTANVEDLIQAQINKLKAETAPATIDDVYEYRSKLDAERESAASSSRKTTNKRGYSETVASGLNPAVASIMFQDESEGSNSDDEDGSKRKSKKRRKHKKEKDDRDRKRSKSEKKSKKHKKEKKHKKSRKRDYDSDSSSSSSSSGRHSTDSSSSESNR